MLKFVEQGHPDPWIDRLGANRFDKTTRTRQKEIRQAFANLKRTESPIYGSWVLARNLISRRSAEGQNLQVKDSDLALSTLLLAGGVFWCPLCAKVWRTSNANIAAGTILPG